VSEPESESVAASTCVVIAAYNEASVLGDVLAQVLESLPRVVVVDDGSSDGTGAIARNWGASVVTHPTNLGQGAALMTGIRYALRLPGVSHVVTFDADGQHRVEDAVAMVRRARDEDLQVVLGSRSLGATNASLGRRLLLRAATLFTRVTSGLDVTDAHNGLRVFRTDAARQVSLRLHGMSHASEILSQIGERRLTYAEHPVSIDYTDYSRAKGQRGYNALNVAYDLALNRLRAAR
jgi:glycosyltransferase involved in cell wall biosynthesis